jgi:hypothetical protein
MSATIAPSAIRDIDIGPEVTRYAALQDAELDGPSATVVAGSILAFAPGLSDQHRQDVVQSLLLAQLAANVKADRQKDPAGWFSAYRGVLEQVAWVVEASTSAARYQPSFAKFTVGTVVDDVFRPKVLAEQLPFVTAAIAAFRSDQNSGAQVLFECPSHSGGIGNFQVALAAEEDGVATIRLAQISFTTPQHVVRLLQEEFTNTAQFRIAFLALSMNEGVFARLRPAIATKLQDRLDRAVAPLQLA